MQTSAGGAASWTTQPPSYPRDDSITTTPPSFHFYSMAMLWPLWFSLLSPTLAQSPTYTPDPLFSDYMSDCYGKNSIYALFQDRMDPHCDEVAGAPVNFTALDECHCESGWLAVKQA